MTVTLYLRPTAGTRLSDLERSMAEQAALEALSGRDPLETYTDYLRVVDSGDQEAINNHPWSYAEDAAIFAATKGWYMTPEDLTLECY